MAYEGTEVAVSKSQEGIRKLIMARTGSRVAFISDPPREGFEASVLIDAAAYRIRIFGECKAAPKDRTVGRGGRAATTPKQQADFLEREERRIWRVLYYHLKSVFEAADSGVMEFRELMLPYIVTKSGLTVAECIVPQLAKAIEMNPARMLGA